MEDLVTVTCNKDHKMMLLQAKSIHRFLAPCRHWIIVNDINTDIESWYRLLKPYYVNHELIIIKVQELFDPKNYLGHHTQQACKLIMSSRIKSKYLCLDSKNFFIKPSNILDWSNYFGNGRLEFVDSPPDDYKLYQPHPVGNNKTWTYSLIGYSEKFNIPCPRYYLAPTTPFVIAPELIEHTLDPEDPTSTLLYGIDGKKILSPSEFIFYSLQVTSHFKPGLNIIIDPNLITSQTCWYFDYQAESKVVDNLQTHVNPSNVKVFGLHSRFLNLCDPGQIEKINLWLKGLEIDHCI
jgi:hypothetical protein